MKHFVCLGVRVLVSCCLICVFNVKDGMHLLRSFLFYDLIYSIEYIFHNLDVLGKCANRLLSSSGLPLIAKQMKVKCH